MLQVYNKQDLAKLLNNPFILKTFTYESDKTTNELAMVYGELTKNMKIHKGT